MKPTINLPSRSDLDHVKGDARPPGTRGHNFVGRMRMALLAALAVVALGSTPAVAEDAHPAVVSGRGRHLEASRRLRSPAHGPLLTSGVFRLVDRRSIILDAQTLGPPSDDGDTMKFRPWAFAKTLAHHDKVFMASAEDVQKLLRASHFYHTPARDDAIGKIVQADGAQRKLEGLYSKYSTVRSGAAVGTITMAASSVGADDDDYRQDSLEGLCAMIEVYWRAILRDVSFVLYETEPMVAQAVEQLNVCAKAGKYAGPTNAGGEVTAKLLFRGTNKGEGVGPHVSQFLVQDYMYGCSPQTQKQQAEADVAATVTAAGWRAMQQGEEAAPNPKTAAEFVHNGRVMGSQVHNDPLYQFPYIAAQVALQMGVGIDAQDWFDDESPSSAWMEGGGPDIFHHVAAVAAGALRHAWFIKWHVGFRVRPEVYAMRLKQIDSLARFDAKVPYPAGYQEELGRQLWRMMRRANRDLGPGKIRNYLKQFETTFKEINKRNNAVRGNSDSSDRESDYLLPLQFPEGSPTHPSWPAGHAVVCGACITVLKAFLKTHDATGAQVKWPTTGDFAPKRATGADTKVAYEEKDAGELTIVGELNKLASNVALGRDFAGVHFRSDSSPGLIAGETYAISYLQDVLSDYTKQMLQDNGDVAAAQTLSLTLEKFNGEIVEIKPNES